MFASQLPAYPRDCSVPEVFSWYAANCAELPAILDGAEVLTYGELDRLTNQLARRFISLGCQPGDFIATATGKSAQTLVTWLAILKAGCVYMPIDPAYPAPTRDAMLADTKPALLVADVSALEIEPITGVNCARVEDELTEAALESSAPPGVSRMATDAAYVMYTSGSTGQPKGVLVAHRGIVRLVRAQNFMNFSDNLVFLQMSALAFDASTWEVWGALLNGASIGVMGGSRLSIDEIGAKIAGYGVTSIFLTSALFNAIVDIDMSLIGSLRQVIVGGDVVSPEHVSKFQREFPNIIMTNGYGPTEATTFSVCHTITPEDAQSGAIPIGRAIAHSTAYILDDDLRPVDDGEVGQLWVGGDGVALGYLNRPELTAERFKADPYLRDGGTMYLTGDLARKRTNGLIDFLGRNDRQVKIDGKRIELDEIEHVLRRIEGVADAIVAVRQGEGVDKRIIAFLKPTAWPASDTFIRQTSDELRRRMPDYMVPSKFTAVETFPLTVNGKIDRRVLLKVS